MCTVVVTSSKIMLVSSSRSSIDAAVRLSRWSIKLESYFSRKKSLSIQSCALSRRG